MATLKFLKKLTYTSQVEGLEDTHVTIVDNSIMDEKTFFVGVKNSLDVLEAMQTDFSKISDFKDIIKFLKPYVEKIENLNVEDEEGNKENIVNIDILENFNGSKLVLVIPFVSEIFTKISEFGSTLKKK